jgi:hypothetical protein
MIIVIIVILNLIITICACLLFTWMWGDDKMNIEDLKCCGNCIRKHCTHIYGYRQHPCDKVSMSGIKMDHYCPHWQHDGLTREERKKENEN